MGSPVFPPRSTSPESLRMMRLYFAGSAALFACMPPMKPAGKIGVNSRDAGNRRKMGGTGLSTSRLDGVPTCPYQGAVTAMNNECVFSQDRSHRYTLIHRPEPLLGGERLLMWIGLNPSTADE